MADFDFDAVRTEAGFGTGHQITIGGRKFKLPPILPLAVAAGGDFEESLAALFGDDEDDLAFLGQHLSVIRSDRPYSEHDPDNPETDIDVLAEKVYGIKPSKKASPNREARRSSGPTKKGK